MDLYFLKSKDVEVFPAGFRSDAYKQSKLTTEKNFILPFGVLSKSTDNNSFLIPDPYDTSHSHYLLGMHGYVFRFATTVTAYNGKNVEDKKDIPLGDTYQAVIGLKSVSTVSSADADAIGEVLGTLSLVSSGGSTTVAVANDILDDSTSELFYGLAFTNQSGKIAASGKIFSCLFKEQPLRLSTSEIRDGDGTEGSIAKKLTTEEISSKSIISREITASDSLYATKISSNKIEIPGIPDTTVTINLQGLNIEATSADDYLDITASGPAGKSTQLSLKPSPEKTLAIGIGRGTDESERTSISCYNTGLNMHSTDLKMWDGNTNIYFYGSGSSQQASVLINSGGINLGTSNEVTINTNGNIGAKKLTTDNLSVSSSSSHLTIDSEAENTTISTTKEIQASSFYATSDIRKKENIKDYKCEKSILDLPIKKFDFIDGAKNQIGCIAQDLQEICPEIVQEDADGFLSINESKIVYLLLQEIKDLKKRVEELEEV